MTGLLLLCILVSVEVLVFSAVARIPMLKRRAMSSRIWRWSMIVILASLPSLIHIFSLTWFSPNISLLFANILHDSPYAFYYDQTLHDELVTEMRWRNFIFWEKDHCFTGHESVCATADNWYNTQANRKSYNHRTLFTTLADLCTLFIFLTPSYLTGYTVYRITRDGRKQKRSSLSSL